MLAAVLTATALLSSAWSSPSAFARPHPTLSPRVAVAMHQVTFNLPDGETKTIEVPEDETILDVAEAQGIEIPYSCRGGACNSCVGKVVSGKVDQSEATVVDEDQQAAGWVCTCVAYPLSDLVVETHQQEAFLFGDE